jgi:hypothetical protein
MKDRMKGEGHVKMLDLEQYKNSFDENIVFFT